MSRSALFSCLLACTVAIGLPAHASDPKAITVGLIAPTNEAETLKKWQPVLDDMAAELKVPVVGMPAKDYGALIKGMADGKVQVAWFGQKSALQAITDAHGEVFAHHVKADGSKGYSSLLLAAKSSPIKSVDEVIASPGKYSLAMGKPSSTSGFLIPIYNVITKNKLEMKTHFSRLQTGSHEDNFLAVANGKVDIATNNTDDLDNFRSKHPSEYAKVKVIWTSEPIGLDPMVMDKRLNAPLKQRIAGFFRAYGKTAQQKARLLQANELVGFARANNKLLSRIADLEAFNEQYTLMNDESLTSEQKDAKFKVLFQKHKDTSRLLGGN
ncbi:phosphonate ABC transporter substrate-binding protein [Chitinimonas prasina]|uniref:Phosphonate ABC transporter substrate-binding protein n=1 Tax=Chitinimonas prasina TaxID=1434937 RepID=A0ABQ5YKP1_9NEIS|nr:phosphate/phosphite/phosphonate ABC transporter substrate-binding protein [Chitinimonas prasina]GLR13499.1 phosphonate ABC transporter substrate-binding protein [Chitinimonas prasina]